MKIKRLKRKYLKLIPLLIFAGLVPLIVYVKELEISQVIQPYWIDSGKTIDFSSYYKMVLIILSGVLATLYLGYLTVVKKVKFKINKYFIPILIYGILIILSMVFAEFKQVALFGFFERYQGGFVLLTYLLMLIYTYIIVEDEQELKIIMAIIGLSTVIIGIIGFGQFFGYDLFKTTFGKRLILPSDLHQLVETMEIKFDKYRIYATLFNPNFVGSYMLLFFTIGTGLFITIKGYKNKIVLFLYSSLMLFNLFGSKSRAGWVGTVIALLFIVIIFRKYLIKSRFAIYALLAITIILAPTILKGFYYSGLVDKISRLNEDMVRFIHGETEEGYFKEIVIDGFELDFETIDSDLKITFEENDLKFFDENNEPLDKRFINYKPRKIGMVGNFIMYDSKYDNIPIPRVEDNIYQMVLNDGRYIEYDFFYNDTKKMLNVQKDRLDGRFYLTEEGFKAQVTNHLTTETKAESALFKGMESIGSSRVYIWSRTIPMLKDRILLGSGPDHYAIDFPQYDIVGKANWMSSSTILVDKPHNLYLDIWVNTGLLSLLAYLAIILMYIFDSFKLYFKSEFTTFSEKLGASILPAIIGYHVSALFNDNIVSVAPAFFAVLAIGITVNYMVRNPEKYIKDEEIYNQEEMIEPNS